MKTGIVLTEAEREAGNRAVRVLRDLAATVGDPILASLLRRDANTLESLLARAGATEVSDE